MTSSTETSDTWPSDDPWARRYFARLKRLARREGLAESVLIVLDARGLDVNDAERERIVTCTSLKQLKIWMRRAVTTEKTNALFG